MFKIDIGDGRANLAHGRHRPPYIDTEQTPLLAQTMRFTQRNRG